MKHKRAKKILNRAINTDLIHLNTIGYATGSTSKLKSSLCFFDVNLIHIKNIGVVKSYTNHQTRIKRETQQASTASTSSGATVQIMEVLAFPPRAGWSIRVNLLSRYGICPLQLKTIYPTLLT